MNKKFRSLRKKLVIKLGVTYLLALLFVFSLIIVKNTVDFNATIAETQIRLKNSLTDKGMLLIKNNSNALVGLIEDNAFSAVEEIVTNTVQSSSDIVYGIFSDIEENNWVYSLKNADFIPFKAVIDKNSLWAHKKLEASSSYIYFDALQIIEFAAPVMSEGEILGVIRYGLSTQELIKTIAAADKQATLSLVQTLFALIFVGVITLLLVFWRTDRVAKQITVPLNRLTDAANIVANGQYEQKINIKTNDEIGILANNFSLMTNIIKRTIADLAKINEIGSMLAKIREETKAFEEVLDGLVTQLNFQFAMIFQRDENITCKLLASHQTNDVDIPMVSDFILKNNEVKSWLVNHIDEDVFTLNIHNINSNIGFSSLVLMSFGEHDGQPLYICLLSNKQGKQIEASELEFCMSIRHLLITSLQNIAMNELLEEQNKNLEDKVNQRTEELHVQNQALSKTLEELEQAQTQLIEAEKMASLGSLVAGISHEVNTPLGVSVTAASHLNKQTKDFEFKFENGKLSKSGLAIYLQSCSETTDIILTNLERAATLIQSFKQIAVDQSSDTKAKFNLKEHLEMLIVSLRPTYKILPININLLGNDVEIDSYPGLLNQVVTNLIINSIKHGLSGCIKGEINITIEHVNNLINLVIEDDGIGIPDNIKNKVFDPFFTTKRGVGGSGLGLNIVYNLVKQKLGGDISIEDNVPKGTRFIVSLPLTVNGIK